MNQKVEQFSLLIQVTGWVNIRPVTCSPFGKVSILHSSQIMTIIFI